VSNPQELAEYVRKAQSGDATAWNALVEQLNGLLWSVTRSHRVPHFDALDVLQTTWLQLARRLQHLEDPERVQQWLVTTARRECLAYHRRSSSRDQSAPFELFESRPTPVMATEDTVVQRDQQRQLWVAIERLPDGCRSLVRMLLSDPEPSYLDVAEALDMPVNSVGPRRQRCLQKLRRAIEDPDGAGRHSPDNQSVSPAVPAANRDLITPKGDHHV
jgi:RNA polymerase sigma factor (sigma-70 family)